MLRALGHFLRWILATKEVTSTITERGEFE